MAGVEPTPTPDLWEDDNTFQVAAWFAVIFCVFGVVGNLTTLIVLLKSSILRRHTNTPFLVSLTVSDLIFSAFILPLFAHRFFTRKWTLGDGACGIFSLFMYCSVAVSSVSLMLISFNTYVVNFWPTNANIVFMPWKSWLIVGGLWVLPFVLMSLPMFKVWGQYGIHLAKGNCALLENSNELSIVVVYFTFFIGIPLLAMSFMYSFVRCKVWIRTLSSSTTAGFGNNASVRSMNQARTEDLCKTFGIIHLCHLICFAPVSLLSVFDQMPPSWKYPVWQVFAYVMVWCFVIMKPIVYFVVDRGYRNCCVYSVQQLFCINPRSPIGTTPSVSRKSTYRLSNALRGNGENPGSSRGRRLNPCQEAFEMEPLQNKRESREQFARSQPVRLTVSRADPNNNVPRYENIKVQSPPS